MIAVAFALAASAAWGSADFLGGLTSRRLESSLVVLFLSQCAAVIAFTVLVLVKAGGLASADFVMYAVLAGVGEAVGLAAFYKGLASGDMGVVAPIAATAAVVPVAVGTATGEAPTSTQAAGIALALLGAVAVAWQGSGAVAEERAQGRLAQGVGLALTAAAGFGLFFVAVDAATQRAGVLWAVFINRITLIVLVTGAVMVLRPSVSLASRGWIPIVAIGVLDIGGSTLYATATQKGILPVVGVVAPSTRL